MNYADSIEYLKGLDLPVLSAVVDIARSLVIKEDSDARAVKEVNTYRYGRAVALSQSDELPEPEEPFFPKHLAYGDHDGIDDLPF